MNLELEIRLITEAFCIENNIPIKRQFTHDELEEALRRVREAMALQFIGVRNETRNSWCGK